jgi:proline iminopeptidase
VRELVVQAPGPVLAVRDSRPEGEPLPLLHGGPGVPDSMQTAVAPLLPEERGIGIDQRGTGGSRCLDGRYGIGAYLADMEAIRSGWASGRGTCWAIRGAGCSPRPTPPLMETGCAAWR